MKPGRLLLLAILALPLAPARAESGYLSSINRALDAADRGDWSAAHEAFAAATREAPDDALGYLGQGLCQLASRQLDGAAALFRRADLSDRADAVAAVGLGVCYFEIGRLNTADAFFARASEADPLLASPYFYRAVIAVCGDRLDAAADLLRRASDLGAPERVIEHLETMRLFASARWQAAVDEARRLKPHLGEPTVGLPLPLPLQFRGEPGSEIVFLVPERPLFSDHVAPRAGARPSVAPPATAGPLAIDSPTAEQAVAGRVPVRISLRQPREYQYVTVSVDGQLKGMTNREPYYVTWDTTTYPDGPHELRAKAIGTAEHEVAITVLVRNRTAIRPETNPYDPAAYRTASRRLATLLMHGQPPLAIEQIVMEAYRQQDPELAIELYEKILANDAGRTDVVEPLLGLYRQQGLWYPPSTIPEPRHGVAGAKRVALTFDDGPRPEYTPLILRLLKRHKARGTFLVTGMMAQEYPELVQAIAADGHEVGSHTYSHRHLDRLSRDEIVYELVRTKVILDEIIGGSSRLFRPPGGHYNQKAREAVAATGYFPVFWTINGGSFSRLAPAEAVAAILKRTDDGAILLLHNGGDNTLPLLAPLLAELARQGYRCVTVSDILRAPTDTPLVSAPDYGPLPPSELKTYAGEE